MSITASEIGRSPQVFWCAAVLAVALRVACTAAPGNFDLESWEIIAGLLRRGEPVYASTWRYNYGPAWMGLLATFKNLPPAVYRLAIVGVLSVADVGIAAALRRHSGPAAALIFLFNPWSIFISGHHHQFDNIAILAGVLGVAYIARCTGSAVAGPAGLTLRQTAAAAAIFGVALVVKHLFYLFPLWMAMRVEHPAKRAIWLILPPAIFAASFVPFWPQQGADIVAHVLDYTSRFNAPLMNSVGPAIFDTLTGCATPAIVDRAAMHGALIAAGVALRRPPMELLAIYCAVLVTFASGTHNHYFAIPVIFLVLYPNRWTWLYTALAIPLYCVSEDGFALGYLVPQKRAFLASAQDNEGHILLVCILGAALILHLRRGLLAPVAGWVAQRTRAALRGSA